VDYKQLRRTLLNRNDGRGIPDRVDPPEITRLAAPTPTSMPYIEPVVLPSTSIPQKPSSTNYPKGYKPGPRENATNELNRLAENDEERRLAQEYTVLKGTTLETLFPKMQRSGRHTKQFNEQRALEATLDRRWKGIPQTFPNREARISHMRSVIDEIASTRNALLRIENALGGDPRLK
jgi:hypothetical protein